MLVMVLYVGSCREDWLGLGLGLHGCSGSTDCLEMGLMWVVIVRLFGNRTVCG